MSETNVIYCGDCKEVLKKIPDESVDLIYLDPPFFSQQEYENFWIKGAGDTETKLGFSDKDWHKLKDSIDPNILREYQHIGQRWKGGHSKGIYVYIAYMRERLNQCERVLKKTGSIYLHCDWHAVHYLKQMMDELFGYDNFRNDITWKRTTAHNDPNQFGHNADRILFYSKSDDYTFNPIYTPYDEEYLKSNYGNKDENGYYMSDNMTGAGLNKNDVAWKGYDPKERGRHWAMPTSAVQKLVGKEKASEMNTIEKLDLLYKNKLILISSNGTPRFKRYLDTMKGLPAQEIWIDIPNVSSQSSERLGYPTQKPEALLQRIIEASSNKTNIVLDPFCGCGTTLAVAKKLGRQFIGIDISRVACDVMRKRLGGGVKVIGGESKEELSKMEPHEFARLVIVEKLGGIISPRKSGDMGIDGWIEFKTVPVQVKRWEHKVGRPEVDKFAHAVERDRKEKGIIVADDFSKDAFAEVARIEKEMKIKIELRKIDDIFKN